MNQQTWRQRVSTDSMRKRSGGRKHWLAMRSLNRTLRLQQVARLITVGRFRRWSRQRGYAALARHLGVSPSTISRDMADLRAQGRMTLLDPPPGRRRRVV